MHINMHTNTYACMYLPHYCQTATGVLACVSKTFMHMNTTMHSEDAQHAHDTILRLDTAWWLIS